MVNTPMISLHRTHLISLFSTGFLFTISGCSETRESAPPSNRNDTASEDIGTSSALIAVTNPSIPDPEDSRDDSSLTVFDLQAQVIDEDMPSQIAHFVATEGNLVFVQQDYDVIAYQTGQWDEPLWRFESSYRREINDVEMCGDSLYLSRMAKTLTVLSPETGIQIGEVDIDYKTTDVDSHAHTMVTVNGSLIVAKKGYWADREDESGAGDSGFLAMTAEELPGRINRIDCSQGKMMDTWIVGEEPEIWPIPEPVLPSLAGISHPSSSRQILMTTREWGLRLWAIQILDVDSGEFSDPLFSSDSDGLGGDLVTARATPSGRIVLILFESEGKSGYGLYCVDLDGGNLQRAGRWRQSLLDLELVGDGQIAVAVHSDESMDDGIMSLDPETCTVNESEDWIQTEDGVISLAVFSRP